MPPKVKLELKLWKWHDRCILGTLGWFVIVTLAAYTLGRGVFVRGIYDLYKTGAIEWFQLGL
jgi:hypothetical protein